MNPGADPTAEEATESPRLVLVVEDDADVRRIVVRYLRLWGYETLEAPDGAIALDLFQRSIDALAVILLDIMLPIHDGVEVARRVLAERPRLPIVAYSAAFSDRIEDDLRALGVVHLLSKPFRAADLQSSLTRAIVSSSTSPTPEG